MENFWDKRYAGADYLFGTKPAAGLIALEPQLVAGGETLVLADGEGRNSVYLASRGYDVRATDYSQVAQVKAKVLAKEASVDVDFVLSDIYDTGWSDEAYDNVVAIFIQFVPPERMGEIFTALALARATRAGGTLLIHGYTPEQVALGTGGPGNPNHMYNPICRPRRFRICRLRLTAPITPPWTKAAAIPAHHP